MTFDAKFKTGVKRALTARHKELILAVLLRNKKALAAALSYPDLNSSVWQATAGVAHRMLWDKLVAYYNNYNDVPPKLQVEADVESLEDILNDYEMEVLKRIISYAFDGQDIWAGEDVASSSKCADRALELLKQMLMDALAVEARQKLFSSDDLPGTFELLGLKANRILSVGTTVEGKLFPDNMLLAKVTREFIPTGLEMMDLMLDGGGLAGEVYGFMAPFGGGKTLLANQGFCNSARILDADFGRHELPPWEIPAVVMVSYEESRADIQERALMFLAEIPRNRILTVGSSGFYSGNGSDGNAPPHEEKYYQRCVLEGRPYVNEAARVSAAIELCNRYGIFIDLSAQSDDSLGGEEGLLGLSLRLEKLLKVEGKYRPVRCIFIDHLAAMTAQRRAAGLLQKEDVPEFVANAPLELKNRICGPFNCFGWFLHQLDVTGNRAGATSKVDHTQSADGKAFGRYCNFCFQCPRQDENGRFVLWCTKHRRTPPRSSRILQIVDDGIRIKDCSDQFVLDSLSGAIVPRTSTSSSAWN